MAAASGAAGSSETISIKPQVSKTDAEREGELTQLNGKLYTVAKAQYDRQCPAVANGSAGSVVR